MTRKLIFDATAKGPPAFEGEIGGMRQSFPPHALRRAYQTPRARMRLKVTYDGRQIEVVPARKLERFLQDKSDGTLGQVNFPKTRHIKANIPSADGGLHRTRRSMPLRPNRPWRRQTTCSPSLGSTRRRPRCFNPSASGPAPRSRSGATPKLPGSNRRTPTPSAGPGPRNGSGGPRRPRTCRRGSCPYRRDASKCSRGWTRRWRRASGALSTSARSPAGCGSACP